MIVLSLPRTCRITRKESISPYLMTLITQTGRKQLILPNKIIIPDFKTLIMRAITMMNRRIDLKPSQINSHPRQLREKEQSPYLHIRNNSFSTNLRRGMDPLDSSQI
jgi:hypothetical protein